MSLPVYRTIDKHVGNMAVALAFKSKKKVPKTPKKILIIKLWALGDSINSLPLLDALKQAFPQSTIDVLAKNNNRFVYEHCPLVHEVMKFEGTKITQQAIKKNEYDVVFDLEPFLNLSALIARYVGKYVVGFAYQNRSKLYDYAIPFSKEEHIVNTYLRLGAPWNIPLHPKILVKLPVQKAVRERVRKKVGYNAKVNLVAIAPGVGPTSQQRMWPAKHYAQVIEQLLKEHKNVRIVLTGTKDEEPLTKAIQKNLTIHSKRKVQSFVGQLNLEEFFSLCTDVKVFLSADTGPMHIAAAQGAKVLGLFGPNLPSIWAPYGKKNKALYHKLWCSPCVINDVHEEFPCINPQYQKCMLSITVEEVVETMNKLIRGV